MALFTSGSPGVMPTPREQVGKANTAGRDLYDAEEERRRKLLAQQRQQTSAQETAGQAEPRAMVAQPVGPSPAKQAPRAMPAPAPAPTFAQLQAQGMARPAPPTAAPAPAMARPVSAPPERADEFQKRLAAQVGLMGPQQEAEYQSFGGEVPTLYTAPSAERSLQDRLATQLNLTGGMPTSAFEVAEAEQEAEMNRDPMASVLEAEAAAAEAEAAGAAAGEPVLPPTATVPGEAVSPEALPEEEMLPEEEGGEIAPPLTLPAAAAAPAAAPAAAAPVAAPAGAPAAAPMAMPAMGGAPTGVTPTGAAFERFGGSDLSRQLQEQLFQQVTQLQNAPSRFEDPAFQAVREASLANLRAQFGAEQQRLEEEMARRGLSASSIAAGRMGDLAGQQARALATLEADLLKEQAMTSAEDRRLMLEQTARLAEMAGSQTRDEFLANIESMKATGQLDMMARELQQEAALQGRSLDLQQARDQVAAELGREQLVVDRERIASGERISAQEIASRESMQLKQFGFDETMQRREAELREKLQTNQITADERMQLKDLETRKEIAQAEIASREGMQLEQFGFDEKMQAKEAELREKLQNNQITADEERQLADLEFKKEEAQRQRDFQEQQDKLDRDLRETLGLAEMSGMYLNPKTGKYEETVAGRRLTAEEQAREDQFLTQLAAVLSGMDEKQRQTFLQSQPKLREKLGMHTPSQN